MLFARYVKTGSGRSARRVAGATRGFLEGVVDDAALAVDGEHRVPVRLLYRRHPNTQVLQAQRTIQRRAAVADTGEQHCVDEARHVEIPLDARERRKDGSNGGLLRLQRELSKTLARKDTRQLKSQCPADVLLAPEERLDRDLCRLLHAREQGIPWMNAELDRECRRDIDAVDGREPVERPEPLVDTVDLHVRRAATG